MKHFNYLRLSRIFSDRRGIAATEFALILPVMVALLTGMVEVATTVQALMKDKQAAHAVADMVSRCRTVSASDISDDFTAAALIITSTKTLPSNVSVFVASVSYDATTGASSLDWSQGAGGAVPSSSTILNSAASMTVKGGSVIVAGIYYSYTPISQTIPPVVISQIAYSSPRVVSKITNNATCDWSL